ncbi:MAG: hypothetical protein ACJ74T_00975 [Pyrinomonadaceae bacterium]
MKGNTSDSPQQKSSITLGITPLEILQTLSCDLVPDEVDRDVRASLGMQ